MTNFYPVAKLVAMAVVVLLITGCSVTGVNKVAIEDRSINGQVTSQSASRQAAEVEVTALNLKPSFKASNNSGEVINSDVSRQSKAPEVASKVQKPATVALLNTAKYQTNSGSLRSAQSSLERALRISPNDPEVYLSLAEVHRRLGEYIQAEQMTLKGIAVAAGQSKKLRSLWSALAKIRSESGDAEGANEAFQKSQSY
jgi:tetratricopeptide (TPR) repeat protein